MSTIVQHPEVASARLGSGRILRSEWLKLRTLRSTWWCGALILALTVLFALLIATSVQADGGHLPVAGQESLAVRVLTIGTRFTELIAAVLGVLVISGEYGTGMIRSTFAAVPHRLPALFAKLVVLAVTVFVLAIVGIALAVAAASGLLSGRGIDPHLGDPAVWMPLIGAAVYLALIAVLAFSIGALLRNTAGGIATVLGLLLVVPVLVTLAAGLTNAEWLRDLGALLPSEAGAQLFTFAGPAERGGPAADLVLNGWGGLAVLVGWILVALIPALVLVQRRDA